MQPWLPVIIGCDELFHSKSRVVEPIRGFG
jgi:hypothetical protein